MEKSRSTTGLVARGILSLGATLLVCASAEAAPHIKITKGNKSEFTVVSHGNPVFACYVAPGAAGQLGTLPERKVKPGLLWTGYDTSSAAKQLNALAAKLARLSMKHQTNTPAYKALAKLEKSAQSAFDKAQALSANCSLGAGEFRGDALSLAPYREKLTANEVHHLLDKVAFGGSPELEAIGINQGLSALVNALVDGLGGQADADKLDADSMVWAKRGFFYDTQIPEYASIRTWTIDALQAAQFYRFLYSRNPLHEWMLLMISGHFATNLNAIDFSYSHFGHYGLPLHWNLLKSNVLGNFSTLTKAMFRDPAMNAWLDNKDNHVGDPNQNFARELLELFTLGQIDPLTSARNYDEESVVAATGFASGFYEGAQPDPESGKDVVDTAYTDELHDFQPRTLFRGVAGAEITAALSADQLVDRVLVNHPGSARYITERFAGQMLYPGLGEAIVGELARDWKAGNFELKPLVRKILMSQAMFSEASRDACVSSPIERTVRLARKILRQPLPQDGDKLDKSYYLLLTLRDAAGGAGQSLFEPPSVFGWKGACNINRSGQKSYGEGWLSEQRMLYRSRTCGDFMGMLAWLGYDLPGALNIQSSTSAEQIIDTIAQNVFNLTLTSDERNALVTFMTTERSDDGSTSPLAVDTSNPDYVWRKVARLVCLMADLSAVNMR